MQKIGEGLGGLREGFAGVSKASHDSTSSVSGFVEKLTSSVVVLGLVQKAYGSLQKVVKGPTLSDFKEMDVALDRIAARIHKEGGIKKASFDLVERKIALEKQLAET